MEEEPTLAAPNLEEEKTNFIISQQNTNKWFSEFSDSDPDSTQAKDSTKARKDSLKSEKKNLTKEDSDLEEFDLSDITHQKADLSREEIIAAAEAAAFAEQ
jgi:ribonuclease-3